MYCSINIFSSTLPRCPHRLRQVVTGAAHQSARKRQMSASYSTRRCAEEPLHDVADPPAMAAPLPQAAAAVPAPARARPLYLHRLQTTTRDLGRAHAVFVGTHSPRRQTFASMFGQFTRATARFSAISATDVSARRATCASTDARYT